MRARLALLVACALVLPSCGSSPVKPRRDYAASVVAVTVPEGLPAGAEAVAWVHWFPECGDKMGPFLLVKDGERSWKIKPVAVTPERGVICLESFGCNAAVEPLRLRVPASGVDHYRIICPSGDLEFDLTPSGPIAPEHRVTILHVNDGSPFVDLPVRYVNVYRDVLSTANTDSTGTAVTASPPCPGENSGSYLWFGGSGVPCGWGAFVFDPFIPLCGNAYHTIAFYEEAPSFSMLRSGSPAYR
jgi:hypothetical protein